MDGSAPAPAPASREGGGGCSPPGVAVLRVGLAGEDEPPTVLLFRLNLPTIRFQDEEEEGLELLLSDGP